MSDAASLSEQEVKLTAIVYAREVRATYVR